MGGGEEVCGAMGRYKLIELNLNSTVSAEAPWTPHKTREVGDQKFKCEKCKIAYVPISFYDLITNLI